MRLARQSVPSVLLLLTLTLFGATWMQAAVLADQTLSGSLVSENGQFSCDHCIVQLLVAGIQTAGQTYVDSLGNFTFRNVRPGSYVIRVEADGYEHVEQTVEVYDYASPGNHVSIVLNRRVTRIQPNKAGNVVDVSQFLDKYPKKAVNAYKKGLDRKAKGKEDDALKSFQEAVSLAPDFYEAHNELGVLYRRAGRLDEAEKEFIRAHELNQNSADPLINLSSLYIDENDPDRAVKIGEEAVKTNSRSASAFFNLGLALYKIAMLDRAEAALKKALELAPKMFQVHLLLANVYLKLRNYDRVMDQLNTYLDENPKGDQREAVQEMRQKLIQAKQQQEPKP